MTASHARASRGLVAVAMMLGWLAAAGDSRAQTPLVQAPLVQTPSFQTPSVQAAPVSEEGGATQQEGPVQLLPAEPQTPDARAPGDLRDAVPEGEVGGIRVRPLQGVDPDSVGTLDVAAGGLPVDMWTGTPRRRIPDLLSGLPRAADSPAMRSLARKLLLSRAAVSPQSGADARARQSVEQSRETAPAPRPLLVLRVEMLVALGLDADAVALIEAATERRGDADLRRLEARARLRTGDLPGACALTRTERPTERFWQALLVLCQTVAGDVAQAEFGLALLTEDAGGDDSLFIALIEYLLGAPAPTLDGLNRPGPLTLAATSVAGLPIPDRWIEAGDPAVLRMLVRDAQLPAERRIALAERAAAAGVVSPETLARTYRAAEFDGDSLASPLSNAEALDDVLARALLFQAAADQVAAPARAELLGALFERAQQSGTYLATVGAAQPLLSDMPLSRDLWWFAEAAAHAEYTLGRPGPGRAWAGVLETEASGNEEAEMAATDLWAIARLAGDGRIDRLAPEMPLRWAEGRMNRVPEGWNRQLTATMAMLEALDEPAAEEAWRMLESEPDAAVVRMPHPALRRGLDQAAGFGRLGETVALSLGVLGEAGPARADALVLAQVVRALRQVGLEDEARSLTLEAAVAHGL